MSDMQKFDDNIIKNLFMFSFKDDEQIYTNGVELVPLYRVVQILEYFKVQELVDKATPKKPIEKTYEYESMNEEIIIKTYHVCGCEKYSEVHHIDRFCSKCGQALDWSKSE